MLFSAEIVTCRGCSRSINRANAQCLYCGTAVPQGRPPSERERFETSREAVLAREEHLRKSCDSKRATHDQVDSLVRDALVKNLQFTSEFTHDHLVKFTNLNPCALKHSLVRLEGQGLVRRTGVERIRSNRTRDKWQYLLPRQVVEEIAPGSMRTNRVAKSSASRKTVAV